MPTSTENGTPLVVLNAGSSSLRFALFEQATAPRRMLSGKLDFRASGSTAYYFEDDASVATALDVSDQASLLEWLSSKLPGGAHAVAHRIVHGGPYRFEPTILTSEVLRDLHAHEAWDPEHLPASLRLVEAARKTWPALPQVGCFDTGFHRDLPEVARALPIPRRFQEQGVRRFGFHGLSYASILDQLVDRLGELPDRCVFAHLGSGCSLAAVLRGRSVDTTMAFTPNSGLPMRTRSGDIDPGLVEFMATQERKSLHDIGVLLNRESGLLGLSGISGDVRDLLAQASNPNAAGAMAVFSYALKKQVGAYAAALGGLDLLAFSGGIGENVADVRRDVCSGLRDVLGIELDDEKNSAGTELISAVTSRVAVHVVRSDEELVIAKQALALLKAGQ
jgi:acetate kinase